MFMMLFRYQSVGTETRFSEIKSYLAWLAQDRLESLMNPPILILEANHTSSSQIQSVKQK